MSQRHNLLVHMDALYRSALYLAKNENYADDLVQETYLRAFKFLKGNKEINNVKAWLFDKRVRDTVSKVTAPDYLMENILRKAEDRPNFFMLFVKDLVSGRRLVPLAGIAVAIFMIVYFFSISGNLKKDGILYLAETKHHNYLMRPLDLDIRSQNPETVVEYLRGQTNSRVLLPETGDGVQLIGSSLSEIDGVKVSQVFYMHEETPVSLFIICTPDFTLGDNKNIDFSGMKEIPINGKAVYYGEGSCGHCQIVGWREAGTQYVMVSRLNSDKMMKML